MFSGEMIVSSKITLKQLEYYIYIVRAGSLTDAALLLHVTPSALSQQLSSLESALGRKLIFRNSGSLEANSDGIDFFERAVRAVSECERAWQVGSVDRSSKGRIRIGSLQEHSVSMLSVQVMQIKRDFNIDNIELHTYPSKSEILTAMKSKTIDIAVVAGDFDKSDFKRFRSLNREEFVVAHRRDSGTVSFKRENLSAVNWVGYTAQAEDLMRMFRTFCSNWQFSPVQVAQVSDPFSALSMIENGSGFAVVPLEYIGDRYANLSFSPIPVPLFRSVHLCANELSEKGVKIFESIFSGEGSD
ncbi:LysR family transcriptional regulator [Rhodococcus sp. BH5]|uniref:LysR family transcriptional regulator n=1 Tax=Rhodococcus sp. BH5 TaxID=2871702 RepID=UPI0022CD3258|nr:LysR family transcriptional regulator [Rhodococcus sp. BH5]MCZ9635187.1 LysR family transcriptional regulator [Rhodococcus sp. BH5]